MYSETYGKQKASKSAKLKYFCQMCRKQCLDENGFRCHLDSEYHMKMMRMYNEDPDFYIEKFSKEFQEAFLALMQEKFKNEQLSANKVFQEMIKKVDHVHLNGTKWTKLNEFIEHLKGQGLIEVESVSHQDCLIQLVDRSAKQVKSLKEGKAKQKQTSDLIDKTIEKQVQRGQELVKKQKVEESEERVEQKEKSVEPQGGNEQRPIMFNLKLGLPQLEQRAPEVAAVQTAQGKTWIEEELERKQKQPNLEKLLGKIKSQNKQHEAAEKAEQEEGGQDKDETPWLARGIVVKVLDEKLCEGRYFKQKGVVREVVNEFGGQIEMLNKGRDRIVLDQKLLQTVVPNIGHKVMILKEGPDRGKLGKLESVHKDSFSGSIYLEDEERLLEVGFDLFSKWHE